MDFKEAIQYVESTGKFSINLGLERIKRICKLIGKPEKELKVIHIAGTNGKGSTSTFIASVLMKQGYRVGVYTSPYLERFTERIKINDEEISEEDVAKLVTELNPIVEQVEGEGLSRPTEFEIITACAYKYFNDKKVDFVVLEVGLGGRYDATNIIDPILSVITTISYDHMHILGDTLGKIAYEKAGIIKQSKPLVVYPQDKEAMEVIMTEARNKNAKVSYVENLDYEVISDTIKGIILNVKAKDEYRNLTIQMTGTYQVMNLLTALCAVETLIEEGVIISRDAVYEGFRSARWPGRFEVINEKPFIILDGGHNIQGIEGIVSSVKKYFPNRKAKIICGILRDKEYDTMLDMLTEIGDEFITLRANSDRALNEKEIKEILISKGKRAYAMSNISEAVDNTVALAKEDDIIIFCGSLHMIGEARTRLKKFFK